MPSAIANSASPFDVPDARTLRPSSSTSSVRIESSRFVEALQEAQREPSRKIEKKPLPPVDEPLEHERPRADDIDLLTSPSSMDRPHPEPHPHAAGDGTINIDPAALPVSHDDRHPKNDGKADAKTSDRLRRRTDARSTSVSTLPTTAAAKLAMRAAGSDALLQAVQHHVRVAVQNEARSSGASDERATKLHTPSTTPAPVPEAAAAPHDVVTEVQAVQTEQQVTSSTSSSSMAEPTAMGARENAALDHVQAILEDPASQLFFDGRRAVLTLDGMTMRITSTADGQASVEVTAVDAAAADRLQSHRAELVDGLQQEGIALTKLDVAHDASASTSQDRQQRKETPEPIDFDQPQQTVKPTTTTTTTTLRAGVIKA